MFNSLSYEVVPNVDVLGPAVSYVVTGNGDSTLIIFIDGSRDGYFFL